MTTTTTDQIHTAVLALAGHCDGARTEDGRGYNRYDAPWGRDAASVILAGGAVDAVHALKVVSKYRRQLTALGLDLPDLAIVQAAHDQERAARAAAAPPRDATTVTRVGATLRIAFAYDAAKVDAARALPGRKFDGATKAWTCPAKHLAAVVAAFPCAILAGDLGAEVEAAQAAAELAERERVAAVVADLARYESIRPEWLYAHQDAGIRWMIEQRSCILADDMGLGKTTQALVAARAIAHRIVVIAPAGLRENWLREAAKVGATIEIYSWAKVPESFPGDYTLIADEAHYAQSMKALRTKRYLALAAGARAHFALTGTPIKNGRPANLYPLLAAIKHPLAQDRKAFELRYCNAGPTRWSQWDVTGAAHLEELHGQIADGLLRRMKGECLDLPAKVRVMQKAELSDAARTTYETTLREMQAEYARRVAEGEISQNDALVLLNHLRHAGSLAKVEAAVELAEEVREQGGSVVLFTAFLDSAHAVRDALHAELITGEIGSADRQASIDRFQAGQSTAIVCTLGAGNVGITLTAAQTVILVDRPWTPGDAIQAEDRCHRIGQTGSVLAVWLQANGADELIDGILSEKHARSELVLSGEARALGVESMSATKLAALIFGAAKPKGKGR